jgi:hypothetical protein
MPMLLVVLMVAPLPMPKPKFPLGRLLATPGAIAALARSAETPLVFLRRHMTGDWGDLCDEDKRLNDRAVEEGTRILSAYLTSKGEKVWLITEWDRSVTTLLLPEEY